MSPRCNGGSCPAVVDQHGENSRQEDIFDRPESTAGRVRRRRIIGHGVFFFFLTFVHQPARDGAPDNGNARAPEQEAEDNLKESDPDQRRPGRPPPTTCEHRPLARAPQGHEERRRQDDVVEARVGGVTRIRQDARGAVRPIAVVALVHAAKATGGAARPPSTVLVLVIGLLLLLQASHTRATSLAGCAAATTHPTSTVVEQDLRDHGCWRRLTVRISREGKVLFFLFCKSWQC
jgi:hypothetical protein